MMDEILLALLKREKMSYQQIVNLGIHRNEARAWLNRLIKQEFVHEEGREDWKRGKKLWYSLTRKGKQRLLDMSFESLNEAFKTTNLVMGKMLSEPERIEEWAKEAHERFFRIKITEEMPLEERIKHMEEGHHRIYGPLTGSLRTMHELYMKASGGRPHGDVFIRVTKEGGVFVIPEIILREVAPSLFP